MSQENKIYGGLHKKIFEDRRMGCKKQTIAIHKMKILNIKQQGYDTTQ